MDQTRVCIKTNTPRVVKYLLGILLLLTTSYFSSKTAHAETDEFSVSNTTEDNTKDEEYENLPSIEASTFPLNVIRHSKSNRVYLFDDIKNRHPKVGRILLLTKDNEQHMAFRVLRRYADKQYIAAKKVKTYLAHDTLEDGVSFTAIEKISDLDALPNSEKDNADLTELELSGGLKKPSHDSELDDDPRIKPHKWGAGNDYAESLDDPSEEDAMLMVQDIVPMDPFRHWLMVGFGYVNNLTPTSSYYFSSGNIRYGLTIKTNPFLKKASAQDSISLETGFYGYKGLNVVTSPDSYTMVSTVLNLRYTLMTSQSFGVFTYVGVMKGWVIAATNSTQTATNTLSAVLPSLGVGFLFQLGPQWFSRIDLGIDALGLNLVLRF